jgi:hypothetical protein
MPAGLYPVIALFAAGGGILAARSKNKAPKSTEGTKKTSLLIFFVSAVFFLIPFFDLGVRIPSATSS